MFDADPRPPAEAAERDARALARLDELAAIGMDLARDLRRRAADDDAPLDPAEAALAFSRLSRAIRLTIALEQRLAEGASARAEAAQRARVLRDGYERAMRAAGRKDQAQAMVAQALAADGRDAAEVEILLEDLTERLDEDDDALWLDDVPVAVMAAGICRDLGVAFDPAVWAGMEDEEEAPPGDSPSAHAVQARAPPSPTGGLLRNG
jgi:hypothetical protein